MNAEVGALVKEVPELRSVEAEEPAGLQSNRLDRLGLGVGEVQGAEHLSRFHDTHREVSVGRGASAFDPAAIEANSVCYTGTHDNDTTVGWFLGSGEDTRSEAEVAGRG